MKCCHRNRISCRGCILLKKKKACAFLLLECGEGLAEFEWKCRGKGRGYINRLTYCITKGKQIKIIDIVKISNT